MIQLASEDLPPEVQAQLTGLQRKVDDEPTFETKAKKAQELWKSKGGKKGKEAFETIVQALHGMCVYVGVCNYCEQSEANDVEHIYPKSFFRSTLSDGTIICWPASSVIRRISWITFLSWMRMITQ